MWRPPTSLWLAALVFPLAGAGLFVGLSFYYFTGGYDPPAARARVPQAVEVPGYPARAAVATSADRKGLLLIDNAHANDYEENELAVLLSRVADRGYTIEFLGDRTLPPVRPEQRLEVVQQKLPRADSFAVIVPRVDYKKDEMDLVKEFLRKGGRLLLIGDPGRRHNINGIADPLGIVFQSDYLYNVVDHDLNFRNIVVRNFRPNPVTANLREIVLYTAGSVTSSENGLAFTDENTFSSLVERIDGFTPVVESADGQVLAIGDLTFLLPPYNSTLDNDAFVSNIADFLTSASRRFDLATFPDLFRGDVDIVLGQASLFELGERLRSLLTDAQILSRLAASEDPARDALFLGLYDEAEAVRQYLAPAGVEVGEAIRTPFTDEIAAEGTALVMLHSAQGRQVLVVIGHTEEALNEVVARLESGEFRKGLVNDLMGVYQIEEPAASDDGQ